MNKLLFLLIGALVLLPALPCGAQMQGDMIEEKMGMDEMDMDWSNYSFNQRDALINKLQDKVKKIDDEINEAQKSDQSKEVKDQMVNEKKDQKSKVQDMIRKLRTANAGNWESVRDEVSNEMMQMKQ